MATHIMFMVFVLHVVAGENYYRNEGFMDHLNTGMKLAQNLLGSESVALKVADFVVRAFHTMNGPSGGSERRPVAASAEDSRGSEYHPFEKRPDHGGLDAAPWRYLIRLLGLQPNQLSAVAVNALIFVAQMITSFLASPRKPSKPHRSDDPAEWILNKNSKKLQDILATAKNESLTDLVEDFVTEYGTQEETSCIRLLVCKITPFVSKMQEAVFGKSNVHTFNRDVRGAAILYRHLPAKEEIRDRSVICEKRFPDCDLNE